MTFLNRRLFALLAVGIAASVSGCANSPTDDLSVEAAQSQAEASRRLGESADRATRAQEELARIQTARTTPAPASVDENLSGVPEELRRPVTIEWSGPAHEAARRVAEIVGWEFHVVGSAPAAAALISVSLRGRPAVKALEDIGVQAQPFGQVVADQNARRIEFRYFSTGRAGASAPKRASMTK
jgi:defect-in-organelle-trafficking protein DotD